MKTIRLLLLLAIILWTTAAQRAGSAGNHVVRLDSVLQTTIDADLDPLKEGQSGRMAVLLTNLIATPIRVDQLVALYSPNLEVVPASQSGRGRSWTGLIPPGRTVPVILMVSSKGGARIGAHPITLLIAAHWMQSGKVQYASSVLQQNVTIGVIGASDTLAVFGVPALVLAPGFLALGMFGLMRRQKAWWYTSKTDGFEVKDGDVPALLSSKEPDFWIVAVLLSIALDSAATYFAPDLFSAYTLSTIVAIYVASLLLGIIGYRVWRWGANRRLHGAEATYASTAIEETDGALEVIRKLGNSHGSMLAQHVGNLDNALSDDFIVGRRGDKSVIVPGIRIGQPIPENDLEEVGKLINSGDSQALAEKLSKDSMPGGVVFTRPNGHVTIKELPSEPTGPSLRFVTL